MVVHLSVIDLSGSVEFAGAGRLFLCSPSNIHRVDSCARTHARGHSLAPVSAPVEFVARGFAGILYPLPSLITSSHFHHHSHSLPSFMLEFMHALIPCLALYAHALCAHKNSVCLFVCFCKRFSHFVRILILVCHN